MNNLKKLRIERKLLQKDIANILNIAKTTYCQYETGKSVPNIESIFKLANFYGVSIDYLLGYENNSIQTNKLDEIELVTKYKQLDEKTKKSIQIFISSLVENKGTNSNCSGGNSHFN